MAVVRDTDRDWQAIAKEDPYWGVLSVDRFKGASLNGSTSEEFYETGERQIATLFKTIEEHFKIATPIESALDFGCGVGRLLIPLAKRVKRAVGVDISPDMLNLARQYAGKSGCANVELVPSDDDLAQVTGSFGLVNSLIVLQHIHPDRGYRIIRRLVELIAPGGFGSLQITYAKSRQFFIHEQHRARYYRREGSTIHDIVMADDKVPVGHVTMYDYDLNTVVALISQVAAGPVLMLATNDDHHLGSHFIFRKRQPR
jgi:SAM-dependent methyltransferase